MVVSPWQLLERLLERSLRAAERRARRRGRDVRVGQKRAHNLLMPTGLPHGPLLRIHEVRGVVPDGLLVEDGRVMATFEAKYSVPEVAPRDRMRNHVFQALSTASALGSPTAVLVYPELAAPISWDVQGLHGTPAHLVAVGLDLFGYVRGAGDEHRGDLLLQLVDDASRLRSAGTLW